MRRRNEEDLSLRASQAIGNDGVPTLQVLTIHDLSENAKREKGASNPMTKAERIRVLRLALFALASCGLPSSGHAAPEHPNVILIVTDDQRPDTIGAAGNTVIRTPNLDRLARQGMLFTRAVSPNPICTPARAELMTGCSGFRTGFLDFGDRGAMAPPSWARHFLQAGYRTGYVGKWHNRGRPSDWGYEESAGLYGSGGGAPTEPAVDWKGMPVTGYRGWVFQTDDGRKFPERGVGLQPDISADFADAALELIEKSDPRPYFLHINFTAPHDPLLMPSHPPVVYDAGRLPLPENFLPIHPFDHGNFRGRDELLFPFPRDPATVRGGLAVYYAVLSHLDAQIGRILEAVERRDDGAETIVIFTSDHGVAIGSHGLRGKQNMYEHTIGVPLIMAGGPIVKNRTTSAQVYLRDLLPTVCELVGLPAPSGIDGVSFGRVLRGESDTHHEAIFGYFRDRQRMIRRDGWKLIAYPRLPRYQLFHVAEDPLELHDRALDPDCAERFVNLRHQLIQWQHSVGDPLVVSPR